MNCAEANQMDMVDYLYSMGYQPQKTVNKNYWYLSPLRTEKHASFVVNKNKNVWYDHGIGKGGTLVDFAMEFYRCNVSEALQKIVSFQGQNKFTNNVQRPPFHLYQNSLTNASDATETAIKIIAAKQPIQDLQLCRYLHQRRIEKSIANKYCHEIVFNLNNRDKEYRAIGFKNSSGGYELRNEYFKGSSSPKYVTYIDNKAPNLSVFEGFFDFLGFQNIHKNQEHELTNYLILNSLSFFERSLLLMEKHQSVKLFLDNDDAGKKYTSLALNRSQKMHDESKLYKGYKDLNEWCMSIGKTQKQGNSLRKGI